MADEAERDDDARNYGRIMARALFRNRKGHGGTPITKRTFTEAQVSAILMLAFEAGKAAR